MSDIVERICVGGWPRFVSQDHRAAQRLRRGYLDEITRTDIQSVDGVRRDPRRVSRLLASLARNSATSVSERVLAADTDDVDGGIHRRTVAEYLDALERLMVIEDVPSWAPALRSRARLRAAAARHFVDPCLAVAALRGSPETLLRDLNYVGFLFESLVVRDLRVYLQPLEARISHYRDSNGLEVDIIVEVDDGRWPHWRSNWTPVR
ncbi:MAG: ATP-binding protein [Mycobacterium sp.]